MGPQVGGRPALQRGHLAEVEHPARALVGQRGVDVAVGDHDLAALERRQDDRVDVLGLVGGVQQGLGAGRQVARRVAEDDLAQLLADRCVPPGSKVRQTA